MLKSPKDHDLSTGILAYNAAWTTLMQFQREHFLPKDEKELKSFSDAQVTDGFLSGASFESCAFINCSFEDTQLIGCYFYSCEFTDCVFRNCDISSSSFIDVLFLNTSFAGGQFAEAVCSDVHFDHVTFMDFR